MSILRTVCALVAAPALATAAAAQAPAAPVPAFGAPPAPIVTPFPAVSSPLTPASPLVAPLPPAPDPLGIAAYPPPPGPTTTLWSFLGLSRAQREYRQRAMARTPLGQLRSRIQTPFSKLTRGLIPPFPPETPSLAELQAPGPVGAAAKVKIDRKGAKDRIEAVQYLGTVDCHYWPEAEDALVAALRVDRNEWVRLEAAKTLLKGCCCTKKTITALTMAATCSDADGSPVEKSPRVVAAAQDALNHCLEAVCTTPAVMEAAPVAPPEVPKEPREPSEPANGTTTTAAWSKPGPAGTEKSAGGLPAHAVARPTGQAYYDRIAQRPWPEIVTRARKGLENAPAVPAEFALSTGDDREMSDVHHAEARADRPANLLDMLLNDNPPPGPATRVAMQTPQPAPRRPATPAPRAPVATAPAPTPRAPAIAVSTPKPTQPKPTAEPSRIPPSVSKGATPTADPFAPKPIEVKMEAPPTAAKPLPTQVTRVLSLMHRPGDPDVLAKEIDKLTPADVTGYGPMALTLVQAAAELTNDTPRSACVRALARSKVNAPNVLAGLQQLTRDRSADVRIEAVTALSELKNAK